MKLDSISLPHPILRKDGGNIDGRFETHVGLEIKKNEVVLTISQILVNEAIQKLIAAGKALFWIDISCSSTMFRKGYSLPPDGNAQIKIDSKYLRDTVVATCMIVAKEDITKYQNVYASDFFDGRTFTVKKGEILGYSGSDTFQVDKNWETPGSKGAFFMFWFHSGKDVKYELGSDPILIKLPKTDYKVIIQIKKSNDLKMVFISLYVYPALLWVMSEYLSERGATYDVRKWHKKLADIMKEEEMQQIGVVPENVPELVQTIFKYPLTGSLNDLNKIVQEKILD